MKRRERKTNLVSVEGVNIDLDQLATGKISKKSMVEDDLFFGHIKDVAKKQAAYDAVWATYSNKDVSEKVASQVKIETPLKGGLTEPK